MRTKAGHQAPPSSDPTKSVPGMPKGLVGMLNIRHHYDNLHNRFMKDSRRLRKMITSISPSLAHSPMIMPLYTSCWMPVNRVPRGSSSPKAWVVVFPPVWAPHCILHLFSCLCQASSTKMHAYMLVQRLVSKIWWFHLYIYMCAVVLVCHW